MKVQSYKMPKDTFLKKKVEGIVIFALTIFISLVFVIAISYINERSPIFAYIVPFLLCIGIVILLYFSLPFAFSKRFEITPDGIIPFRYSLRLFMTTKDRIILFNEIQCIKPKIYGDIGLGGVEITLKSGISIVILKNDIGDEAFNNLLKLPDLKGCS